MIRLLIIFTVKSIVFCMPPIIQIPIINNTSTQNTIHIVNNVVNTQITNSSNNSAVNITQQMVILSTSTTTSKSQINQSKVSTIKRNYRYPFILPSQLRTKSSQVKIPLQSIEKSSYSTQSKQITTQNYPNSNSLQFVATNISTQYRENIPHNYIPDAICNPYYPINLFKPFRLINPYLPYYPYFPILPCNIIQLSPKSETTTNNIQNINNLTKNEQNVTTSQSSDQNENQVVTNTKIINEQNDKIDNPNNDIKNYMENDENPTLISSNNDINVNLDESDCTSNEDEFFGEYVPVLISSQSGYRYLKAPPIKNQ